MERNPYDFRKLDGQVSLTPVSIISTVSDEGEHQVYQSHKSIISVSTSSRKEMENTMETAVAVRGKCSVDDGGSQKWPKFLKFPQGKTGPVSTAVRFVGPSD